MNGLPADARRDLPLALVAAATTWVTMLSWRGFSTQWGEYMGPLLLLAAVVAVGGVLFRAAPMPRRVSLLLHILVVGVLTWLMIGGSLLHPVGGAHHVANALNDAWISSETYQPPIPATVPGIASMMIPCGALSLLVVDVLACWLRRVSLAGLPLLAIYCVPISLLGRGVSWLVFLVAAVGFLLMMYLQESAHITRWGRPLGSTAASVDPSGFGVSTGASKTTAGAVGGIAVVLAVIVPVFIPTLKLDGLGLFGPGGSGGDGVKVVNPITDMNRDLQRGKNVPLIDVTTDDPDPSYLRIAVLTRFNDVEWSPGDRKVRRTTSPTARCRRPRASARTWAARMYPYDVSVLPDFDSRWLPTQPPVSRVTADGNWRYDDTTMDFIAGDDDLTTASLNYSMTAVDLDPHLRTARSMPGSDRQGQRHLHRPARRPAVDRPRPRGPGDPGGDTPYEKAVALQNWFREDGGFTYSPRPRAGQRHRRARCTSCRRPGWPDRLLRAVRLGDGRDGAELGIPARVGIGFLNPDPGSGPNSWVYSSHDMHAWPELYFDGTGWVRFEPTPGTRAATTPSYTHEAVRKVVDPKSNQTQGGKLNTDSASPTTQQPRNQTSSRATSTGSDIPWTWILLGLGVLAVLVALALVPRSVRRSRRTRRLAGGAEEAWAELRDSAIDLGVSWPAGRSPHETGHHLAAWFGPEPDGPPPVRPPRGRGLSPGAEDPGPDTC